MRENDPFVFAPPDWARNVRFYVTAEQACPYLTDRRERKIFASLSASNPPTLNRTLTEVGFRRSQNIIYRPACKNCSACRSARIPVDRFRRSKRWRRVLRDNADLSREWCPNKATDEQYRLLQTYLDHRHPDGGMNDMGKSDYTGMVETSPISTGIVEYRRAVPGNEPDSTAPLAAAALTDVLHDGLSMIYSFFDPSLRRRSLGSFVILDAINRARAMGLPYVYMGYWVRNSPKMRYKEAFRPLEIYDGSRWRDLA